MELIIGGVVLFILLAFTGIYLSDRDGWNTTFKRVSRISRASIEARSFKSLERVRTGEKESWEAAFSGRTSELVTLPEAKHQIISHDYYLALGSELWPQWTCKCGAKNQEVVSGSLRMAERTAARAGRRHVRNANKRDSMLNSGSQFKF